MKTRWPYLVLFIGLNSCNFVLPGDKQYDSVFDVDYINDLSNNITLVSYKDGGVKDKFEIKSTSRKRFNNVIIKLDGNRINAPFVLQPDSVLVILNYIDQKEPMFKTYVKQCGEFLSNANGCIALSNNSIFMYGIKSDNSFQRKWYSLNRGEFLYTYTLDEKFFENALKMYDYKSRGL